MIRVRHRPAYALLFMGPAVLFFTSIVIIPFIMGMGFSLTSWDGVSGAVNWIGFSNYQGLVEDERFMYAFSFTIRYTLTVVFLQNLLAFLLALLLSQKIWGANISRTMFFLPNLIAGVLLGFIWRFIFSRGFLSIGEITNIPFFQLPWLGTARTGFWALVIVSVWRMTGYLMVIYIAGLTTIPDELLECAVIDGANAWQKLLRIKIPLVVPSFTVCLFLSLAWEFKMFDLNFSLTKGGPFGSTRAVALDIYNEAFINANYGLGSAKSVVFFIVVALITLLQVKATMRKEVQL